MSRPVLAAKAEPAGCPNNPKRHRLQQRQRTTVTAGPPHGSGRRMLLLSSVAGLPLISLADSLRQELSLLGQEAGYYTRQAP